MCECGQTCPSPDDSRSKGQKASSTATDMGATNIIIFSNQSDDTLLLLDTNFTIATESNLQVLNVSYYSTVHISGNSVADTTKPSLNKSKSNIPSSLWPRNQNTIVKNFTKANLTRQENKTTTQSIPNEITGDSNSKLNALVKQTSFESLNRSSNERLQLITVSSVTSAVTKPYHPQQQVRSINKERQHVASEVLPPALTTEQTSPSQHGNLEGSDKLFVLDRDTLWGMLREVVHVELDKKQPSLEDTSHRSKHSEKNEFD
jgi:Tfp pilus assembly major pilin PilA